MKMNTSSGKIKSLNLWITSRLIRKIGLTILLGMVIIFILDTYYFLSSHISNIQGDIQYFSANQVKNLQVFNYYRISNELEIFSKYTSIEYVEFFDQYGLRIAFAGKELSASKNKLSTKYKSSWRIEFIGNDLFVVIGYPIHGDRIGYLGHLSVYISTTKRIKDAFRHLSVYFIVLIVIFFWFVRVVGKAAARISEPIKELSAVFSNVSFSFDFPQIAARLEIREFKVLLA